MSSTNVKVAVRIRPLTSIEHLADAKECIYSLPNEPVEAINGSTVFRTQPNNSHLPSSMFTQATQLKRTVTGAL